MPLFDGVIKYDLNTGKSQTHEFGQGCYGGEAVFAPHPGGKDEDDGWLITFVYNSRSETSELVARVLIPQPVPYGFHGAKNLMPLSL